MLYIPRFGLVFLLVFKAVFSVSAQVTKQQVQNFNTKQLSRFTENKGQITDQDGNLRTDVKYIYNAPGFKAVFKGNSFSYEVFTVEKKPKQISEATGKPVDELLLDKFRQPGDVTVKTHRIDIVLPGANKHPEILVEDKSADYNNYYLAHTPEQGVQKVYSYTKLTYKNIWPKVDLVFYARKEGELKYDIVVHPGGNLSDVKFAYDGATVPKVVKGKLSFQTSLGTIKEHIPTSYTEQDNEEVSIKYISKHNTISFSGKYNSYKTLVIDPVLIWSTYLGGNGEERRPRIATDNDGYVYIGGETGSSKNIATSGAHLSSIISGNYGMLLKFSNSGVRQWGTYYGNTQMRGIGICVDVNNHVIVTGLSYGQNGIATTGAHQITNQGPTNHSDAFILKFDSNGKRKWGTFYGGNTYTEGGYSLVGDEDGNIIMVGATGSSSGIATNGSYQTTLGGKIDAMIVKFDSSGVRQWATYFGGSEDDYGYDVSIDLKNNIYVVGLSGSTNNVATVGAHQTMFGGGSSDALLMKFNSSGKLLWSTYYGGKGSDEIAHGITCEGSDIYITGRTTSISGIATSGSHLSSYVSGQYDGFIAKFDSTGLRKWGTYFGSKGDDVCSAICGGSDSSIYIVGDTDGSTGIATKGVYQDTLGGYTDAFVAKFSYAGKLQWCSYFGGEWNESGYDIAVYGGCNIYITGETESDYLIASTVAHQNSRFAFHDAYLAKFPTFDVSFTGTSSICLGSSAVYKAVNKNGSTFTWKINGGKIIAGTDSSDSITVLWDKAGKGSVKLMVSSASGCYDSITKDVTVYSVIFTAFTFTENCQDSLVVFTNKTTIATGNGNVATHWNFGDGDTSARENPTHLYKSAGTYKVTLTIKTTSGCVDSFSDFITVHFVPVANFSTSNVCLADSIYFKDSSIAAESWLWDFGDSTTSTLQNPAHYYAAAGKYVIKLLVANSIGCTDSIAKQLEIVEAPKAIFSAVDVCVTDSLFLADSSKGATEWFWDFGDGSTSRNQHPGYKYNKAGTYTIYLSVANSIGCTDIVSHSITVDSTCVWPGDVNADKVVDNKDILAIGIGYSDTGSIRTDTSTVWKGNRVKDWNKNFLSGANYKHADGDGDGIIGNSDTNAVTRNYSKMHAKKENKNRGKNTDPVLKVEIQNDSLKAGDTLVAYIILGENALPAKDIYGLAFSLNYNNEYFSSVSVDYTGNWLGANTLGYSNSTNVLDLALTKTDNKNVTGSGRIATVKMILKEQELDLKQLKLEIVDNITISDDEHVISTNLVDDSISTYKAPNSMFKTNKPQLTNVNIYPNPFTNQTNVEFILSKSSSVSIEIYDMTGNGFVISTNKNYPQGKNLLRLDTNHNNFNSGIYVLKVTVDGIPTYKQLVKTD